MESSKPQDLGRTSSQQMPLESEHKPTSSHIEKKREILEGLKRQVTVLKNLLEKQQTLASLEIEDLLLALEQEREAAFATFSPSVLEWYKKYKVVQEEINAGSFDFENEIKDDNEDFSDSIDSLESQAEELFTDEVAFVSHIDTLLNRLKSIARLNAACRSEKRSPDDISVYVGEDGRICGRFLPEEVEGVDEDAFSTAFVIKASAWRKYKTSNTEGFFVPGTNHVFIRGGSSKASYKMTLGHERMHHMLDEIPRYDVKKPSKIIDKKIKRVLTLLKYDAPEAMISTNVDSLMSEDFIKLLINVTQNEFLAAHDQAQSVGFSVVSAEERLLLAVFGEKSRLTPYQEAVGSLCTAGSHIEEAHAALESLVETFSSTPLLEQYKEQAKKQVSRFEELFVRMVDQVKKTREYTSVLGPESDLDVRALLLLLKPASYHHIDTYLRHEHGDDIAFIDDNKAFFGKGVTANSLQRLVITLTSASPSGTVLSKVFKEVQESIVYDQNTFTDQNQESTIRDFGRMSEFLEELETLLLQKDPESFGKGSLRKEYLVQTLISSSFENETIKKAFLQKVKEIFLKLPDGYFSSVPTNQFIKEEVSGMPSTDHQEVARPDDSTSILCSLDEHEKQEMLQLWKRVGLC